MNALPSPAAGLSDRSARQSTTGRGPASGHQRSRSSIPPSSCRPESPPPPPSRHP